MKKYTITKITRYTTKKDGSPLINKLGKPYESVSIQTEQTGDSYLSGFGSDRNKTWQEGSVVELEVIDKYSADGKTIYHNFREPNINQMLSKRVDLLEARITVLEGGEIQDEPESMPQEDISSEEMPF